VELARNDGLTPQRLAEARRILMENVDEIRRAWGEHFGR
jgi:hypothetical protein